MKNLSLIISAKASVALFGVREAFAADSSEYIGSDSGAPEYELKDGQLVVKDAPAGDAYQAASDAYHGAEKASGLPQMDPTWFPSQLFWLALTFLILYVIFARKVLPQISATLETRREQIQGDLDSAQSLKEEAETVQAAYEAILDDARKDASEAFLKAEESNKKKTQKKIDAFREKTAKQISETEATIETAKKDAMSEMHSIAAEIASAAAEKIVGVSTDLDKAKSLVKNLDKKAA